MKDFLTWLEEIDALNRRPVVPNDISDPRSHRSDIDKAKGKTKDKDRKSKSETRR